VTRRDAKPNQTRPTHGGCPPDGPAMDNCSHGRTPKTRDLHSTPKSIAQITKTLAGWRENQHQQHGVCPFKGIGDGDLRGSDSRQRIQEVRICSVCAFFTNCSRKIQCPKAGFCHHKNKTRSDSTRPRKPVATEILLSTPSPFQQRTNRVQDQGTRRSIGFVAIKDIIPCITLRVVSIDPVFDRTKIYGMGCFPF